VCINKWGRCEGGWGLGDEGGRSPLPPPIPICKYVGEGGGIEDWGWYAGGEGAAGSPANHPPQFPMLHSMFSIYILIFINKYIIYILKTFGHHFMMFNFKKVNFFFFDFSEHLNVLILSLFFIFVLPF